jgi:orotate phosphoribosyltransferase
MTHPLYIPGVPDHQQHVADKFFQAGAFLKGHFVYNSGRHGELYVNKDALYPHTEITSALCAEIALHFSEDKIDVVVAPALGGIILTQWIAHHLSRIYGKEVLAVYAEKVKTESSEGTIFEIRRGYDQLISGKNVLMAEDILTTGSSLRKVVKAAREAGAHVVAGAALCNRGKITAEGVGDIPDLYALLDLDLPTLSEAECALHGPCSRGVAVNEEVGHGAAFVARKARS